MVCIRVRMGILRLLLLVCRCVVLWKELWKSQPAVDGAHCSQGRCAKQQSESLGVLYAPPDGSPDSSAVLPERKDRILGTASRRLRTPCKKATEHRILSFSVGTSSTLCGELAPYDVLIMRRRGLQCGPASGCLICSLCSMVE